MIRCSTAYLSLTPKTKRSAFINTFGSRLLSSVLNSPATKDVEALHKLLDYRTGSVITDSSSLERYNTDWTSHYKGRSTVLVRPKTTSEVSKILNYCNHNQIGVVPQAGNTGLVGGSVPISDEIILSVEGFNEITSFDETNGVLTCGAGCILQNLHDFVGDRHHLMPIDLGAKGSCMIGGNVSTNAGGQHYYRFGSLHANVLGLEVVLADGEVLDLMNTNRKDNTGYHLKHLFIGAEGTLGVVTKVVLSCPRLPKAKNVAFLACETFDAVQKVLILAKDELGEILSAFEFMDREVLEIVKKTKNIPLKVKHQFYLLVESQGSTSDHDMAKMEMFLTKAMENGDVVDGVLAQDGKQVEEMWEIRESCNPSTAATGYTYKYDISVPISDFYDLVEEMRVHLSDVPDAIPVAWGHVIDGNLHFNVTTPGNFEEKPELTNLIESRIFTSVIHRSGSISAEHGLGQSKNNYLNLAKDKNTLNLMCSLKRLFDPNGILNPGKFLPTKES